LDYQIKKAIFILVHLIQNFKALQIIGGFFSSPEFWQTLPEVRSWLWCWLWSLVLVLVSRAGSGAGLAEIRKLPETLQNALYAVFLVLVIPILQNYLKPLKTLKNTLKIDCHFKTTIF